MSSSPTAQKSPCRKKTLILFLMKIFIFIRTASPYSAAEFVILKIKITNSRLIMIFILKTSILRTKVFN